MTNRQLFGIRMALILLGLVVAFFVGYKIFSTPAEESIPMLIQENAPLPAMDENEKEDSQRASNVSYRALLEREYAAPALAQGEVIATTSTYTKRAVTYQSDDLTISGVLYIPTQAPPENGYPVLITNHGYIDPAVYTTGRGLKREQEYFASRGYVVLHPDYRNHAGSTKTGGADPIADRLGYITDIIHSVSALKNSSLPIDKNNVTLLGHSMGGGASLSAAIIKPDVANRVVLYAPVTVNYLDSYLRYQKDDPERASKVITLYGSPEQNPKFWEGLNGEPYLDRVTVPVQIYHGTSDADVPYSWSTDTLNLLKEKGKNAELITYEGEGHEFSFAWTQFMQGVEKFSQE